MWSSFTLSLGLSLAELTEESDTAPTLLDRTDLRISFTLVMLNYAQDLRQPLLGELLNHMSNVILGMEEHLADIKGKLDILEDK